MWEDTSTGWWHPSDQWQLQLMAYLLTIVLMLQLSSTLKHVSENIWGEKEPTESWFTFYQRYLLWQCPPSFRRVAWQHLTTTWQQRFFDNRESPCGARWIVHFFSCCFMCRWQTRTVNWTRWREIQRSGAQKINDMNNGKQSAMTAAQNVPWLANSPRKDLNADLRKLIKSL